VFGRDTRAETDSILRDSRIVHGRDPKTATPQFVPQSIHQLAITNDDWHHVSRRRPGIESELAKLRMEVIRVFPKFRAQLRLARPELQRFENCGDHDRWQRARVHVRMRVKTQILKRLLRTGDETAQRSERF